MPGIENVELPEYYNTQELTAMNAEELNAAKANGFRKVVPTEPESVHTPPPLISPPTPAPPQDPYDWSGLTGHDFVTPSGRTCFMRPLGVKEVAAAGILNKVTRLEGLADKLVKLGNGEPPAKEDELTEKDITEVTGLLEKIVPLAVVKPTIWPVPPEGEERVMGRVYVDSVPMGDQIAIVEKALGELTKYDSFRK